MVVKFRELGVVSSCKDSFGASAKFEDISPPPETTPTGSCSLPSSSASVGS